MQKAIKTFTIIVATVLSGCAPARVVTGDGRIKGSTESALVEAILVDNGKQFVQNTTANNNTTAAKADNKPAKNDPKTNKNGSKTSKTDKKDKAEAKTKKDKKSGTKGVDDNIDDILKSFGNTLDNVAKSERAEVKDYTWHKRYHQKGDKNKNTQNKDSQKDTAQNKDKSSKNKNKGKDKDKHVADANTGGGDLAVVTPGNNTAGNSSGVFDDLTNGEDANHSFNDDSHIASWLPEEYGGTTPAPTQPAASATNATPAVSESNHPGMSDDLFNYIEDNYSGKNTNVVVSQNTQKTEKQKTEKQKTEDKKPKDDKANNKKTDTKKTDNKKTDNKKTDNKKNDNKKADTQKAEYYDDDYYDDDEYDDGVNDKITVDKVVINVSSSANKGATKPLVESDYQQVAARLNLEPALIKAVVEVEAGPKHNGFWQDGKPIINFHLYTYKKRAAMRGVDLDKYIKSHPVIFEDPDVDTFGSVQAARWAQLDAAMTIDDISAIEGTFWGMFQLGGFNWKACGASSIYDFVTRMCRSERDQLDMFANFIESANIVDFLRKKDWAGFARKYNGPQYEMFQYDKRIAAAYDKNKQ